MTMLCEVTNVYKVTNFVYKKNGLILLEISKQSSTLMRQHYISMFMRGISPHHYISMFMRGISPS